MSADHSRAQRDEFKVHLDPAGDRSGARVAGGLPAAHFERRGKVRRRCQKMRMRCIWTCNVDSFEQADFGPEALLRNIKYLEAPAVRLGTPTRSLPTHAERRAT